MCWGGLNCVIWWLNSNIKWFCTNPSVPDWVPRTGLLGLERFYWCQIVTDLLSVIADCFPHLSFRCGLQVAQAVAESLSCQAELPMLLLDGGHTLEHHLIILPVERVKMAVRTKILILQLYKCFPCICCAPIMSQTKLELGGIKNVSVLFRLWCVCGRWETSIQSGQWNKHLSLSGSRGLASLWQEQTDIDLSVWVCVCVCVFVRVLSAHLCFMPAHVPH